MLAGVWIGGCPGRQAAFEIGAAACADGRDNDGDGAVDCADPDCAALAFCAPGDGGGPWLDHGRHADTTVDAGLPPDLPPPDRKLPSSYGKTCTYTAADKPCADGTTVCAPGKYTPGTGFCTHTCGGVGSSCPPGPPGTSVTCGYQVYPPVRWYCLYRCTRAPCPPGLQCYGNQWCFP